MQEEEIAHQKRLLQINRTNAKLYKNKVAYYGNIIVSLPETVHGLEEAQKNIARIKYNLKHYYNIIVEDDPLDEGTT